MNNAKIFTNGRSQAVRLPKEYRFTDKEVYINKIGDVVMLYSKKDPWSPLFESLNKFSDDYMNDRNQPNDHENRQII